LRGKEKRNHDLEASIDLREIIDSLDAQVVVVDRDYRIRFANSKLCHDLGMSEGELLGKYCYQAIHVHCEGQESCREGPRDHLCPWEEIGRTGNSATMVHRHRRGDGRVRVMEIKAFPVFGEDGQIHYLVETLWDITERTQLEEKAREQERLEGVLEMAIAVAHELNTPLFTVLGTAQLALRQWGGEESLRKDLETIVRECRRMKELTQRMIRIDRYAAKQYVGHLRLVDIQGASSLLHHTEKMAALGQLTAAVAHEIANPLYLILGHAQLLLRECDEGTKIYGDIQQIEKSARICRRIVMNLLKVARKEGEESEVQDVNTRLTEVLDLLEHAYALEGVKIERDLDPHLPPLRARHDQLSQVYLNLLNNSFQSIEGRGTIYVRTKYHSDRGEILIEVEDTGRGIPEGIRDRIFEPFFTTKEAGRGTGLGLSVSKEIVERHGGRISVQSEQGRGTCFAIWIPLEGNDGTSGTSDSGGGGK
jgi:PAS domain S-box-containing protein